uniref:Uncharacterized protein n=1 Tax=Arundo donax TaxID=35708 RepID=A0A0A9AMN3_ARUDO
MDERPFRQQQIEPNSIRRTRDDLAAALLPELQSPATTQDLDPASNSWTQMS